MQIRFLGTGPSSPIPRIYCSCDTCRDARKEGSHSKRLRSSILLTAHSQHVLFDVGPDVLQQLECAKTYCVDTVFFTHAHNDAAGGFFDLNDLLRQQNHQAAVYVEAGTWKRLRQDLSETKPWMKIHLIKVGQKLNIFGTRIIPFRVEHSVTPGFPTLGYRINNELVYASDVKKIPQTSERYLKNITHLILDGCAWFSKQLPSHLNIEQSIQIARQFNARYLYPTQVGHRYPPHEMAQRAVDDYLKKQPRTTLGSGLPRTLRGAGAKMPVKVRLAYDGMEINLD